MVDVAIVVDLVLYDDEEEEECPESNDLTDRTRRLRVENASVTIQQPVYKRRSVHTPPAARSGFRCCAWYCEIRGPPLR